MTFKIDTREMKELEKDLRTFAKRSMPFAARNYLNRAAFGARSQWQRDMKSEYVLRNKFTVNSVRVEKAKGLSLASMKSETGSIADFIADQETGATLTGGGKHGKPIPTSFAAGQGLGTQPRTKLVRRVNKMASIRLTNRGGKKGTNIRQRVAIALRLAREAGDKFVFLELQSSVGLFRITGTGKRSKIKMVWSLSHSSVKIEPNHMLAGTLKTIEPRLDEEFVKAVREQLRRNRVFGF